MDKTHHTIYLIYVKYASFERKKQHKKPQDETL